MANFIGYKLFIDMRILFVSIAAALMLGFSAMADEGMWMLPLLQKLNAGAMKDLGCRLTPDQIYSVNHSSLKDAIVIFGGGCTGEMISDKGLLVTNTIAATAASSSSLPTSTTTLRTDSGR